MSIIRLSLKEVTTISKNSVLPTTDGGEQGERYEPVNDNEIKSLLESWRCISNEDPSSLYYLDSLNEIAYYHYLSVFDAVDCLYDTGCVFISSVRAMLDVLQFMPCCVLKHSTGYQLIRICEQ